MILKMLPAWSPDSAVIFFAGEGGEFAKEAQGFRGFFRVDLVDGEAGMHDDIIPQLGLVGQKDQEVLRSASPIRTVAISSSI